MKESICNELEGGVEGRSKKEGLVIRGREFEKHHSTTEEGNGNTLQYSCLENSMDGGAW